MPFLDHLEELRWRILWSVVALIVGVVVGFLLVQQFDVLNILISPYYEVMGEGERLKFSLPPSLSF